MSAPALVRAGTAVYIRDTTTDATQNTLPLIDPSGGVTVTLKKPDGTVYQAAQAMARSSTGVYALTQQTATTDPLGTYSGDFVAINGSFVSRSLGIQLFTLVSS